jgi:hypothetical protein
VVVRCCTVSDALKWPQTYETHRVIFAIKLADNSVDNSRKIDTLTECEKTQVQAARIKKPHFVIKVKFKKHYSGLIFNNYAQGGASQSSHSRSKSVPQFSDQSIYVLQLSDQAEAVLQVNTSLKVESTQC